ncbi:MAG: thiamine phosphate synthase [Gammaproteobacteria bacterium]|nr:MAG: thiamine phosphate synthase [Gammaproteobacteria bacterium]
MQKLTGLYVIADAACIGNDKIITKTEEVLTTGVKIIQYRDKINSPEDRYKIAAQLRKLTHDHTCLLIINDDAQLALDIDADGVHLGKNDTSIEQARRLLGDDKIIGASCYAQYEDAQIAINASADYIAFGSFFPSTTKPNAPRAEIALLTKAKQQFKTPICAIGGITPQNATNVLTAGADMIAVISAVFNASSPKQAVQEYLSLM